MVVASRVHFSTTSIFAKRGAPELGSPDHHRAVQQTALLEVFDESGNGLVDGSRVVLQLGIEIAVMIPGCMHYIDEADAAFDHASSHQAIPGEVLVGLPALASSPDTLGFRSV